MQAAHEIAFGRFRLDLTNECLWQGAHAISLRPKAFAVLRLLVQHPGLLVTKQQVLDTVWPGTFVGDAVLKDNIRQLREALEDDASSPTYIETAHRRGYRFIGKLTEPSSSQSSSAAAKVPPSRLTPNTAAFSSSAPANGVLGRDAELARMRGWLERALAGERQTIFITGEPGIGKTTIVEAFLEQAVQVPGLRIARGQCLDHYGAGEAYLPVLDGFSRLCRSRGGAKVLDVLRQEAPAWLAQMPSLVSQSERETLRIQVAATTRERMLREMAEASETLTSESPLLLILEDLHWSDYSTLDLVSYLARRQDSARLLVIGTYRPVDVIVGDHPLKGVKRELQAHGLCHELPLECLSEEAVGKYLTARFPGHEFPLRLRRTIYRRTEGNPLFMVNLVEYLIDQNMIVAGEAGWKLQVDISDIEQEVPTNLRQLIEKQIERLSSDEHTVLEAASVAGVESSCAAIAAGLDMPTEWIEKHCEELARRHQFLSPGRLVELPDGTITPRHRFIHILYRDVPYRMMPPMRRSQIHRRIAERGVAIYGDRSSEIAAELAMHFEQSRDWPRSLEYLLQAAQNAAACSAHHEVIDLGNRALDALKLVPETAERAKREMKLRMILSVSLMAVKGFASAEVERINARGRELFWRHGPSPELFFMLWSLNMYHQFSGEMHLSLEISYQLMHLAENLKDDALTMEAHRAIGAVLVLLGRCSEALEHLEKGAALYATHHDHTNKIFSGFDNKVMVQCFAAMALLPLGYPDQSAEKVTAGLALARELPHPQTLVVALHIAAQLHQLRGEASQVHRFAKEAMELADENGLALWVTYGLIELGWAEAELGDAEGGIEKMQRGVAEYEVTGAKLRTPYFLGLLADQLCKAGRLEEGLAVITRALTLAEHTGEGYAIAELHRIKGELFVKSADLLAVGKSPGDQSAASALSQARTCFAEALTIASQQGTKWWELRAAMSKDRLELSQGGSTRMRLAEIYSSFTEGHENADLKQARARLDAAAVS
jgi:DNA-binding winged helix-turn-helix (wHTH) protein/predicted ATPase